MSQAQKKRKTFSKSVSLPSVSNEVAKLRRTVLASKPEVRQSAYSLSITGGATTPLALISPALIDAGVEEIRLHRITVNYIYNVGDVPWAIIYSPRQGYATNQIPIPASAYAVGNYLRHMDGTKQRVFVRKNFGRDIVTGSDGDSIIEVEKKFSIPMKVGMINPGTATVNHNQLYYIGGNWDASTPRTVEVTVWYTC